MSRKDVIKSAHVKMMVLGSLVDAPRNGGVTDS